MAFLYAKEAKAKLKQASLLSGDEETRELYQQALDTVDIALKEGKTPSEDEIIRYLKKNESLIGDLRRYSKEDNPIRYSSENIRTLIDLGLAEKTETYEKTVYQISDLGKDILKKMGIE